MRRVVSSARKRIHVDHHQNDPLGLASLRDTSNQLRLEGPANPLVLHKRVTNKQRAQVLASSPFETAEINRERERSHTAAAPKPLVYLQSLPQSAFVDNHVVGNIISQLASSLGDLQPKHISEIFEICVRLRYTPEENEISSLVNGMLHRPDAQNLALAIGSLRKLDHHSLADVLSPVFSHSINSMDRPDKLSFLAVRAILITAILESITINRLDEFACILNREIPLLLEPRQLLFLPRALVTFSDKSPLPALLHRIDGVVTSRLPVAAADAVECLYGLKELGVNCTRWRMYTEAAVEREDRTELLAELSRRKITLVT